MNGPGLRSLESNDAVSLWSMYAISFLDWSDMY